MKRTFLLHEPELFNYNKAISKNMQVAHFHQTYEIYYLISGSRRYFIKDRFYDLEPGDLILIEPETVHKIQNTPKNISGEFHERYLLCFSKHMIDTKFMPIFKPCLYHPSEEDSIFIKNLIEKMGHEVEKSDIYSILMYESYLTQILTLLSRKYYQAATVANSNINTNDNKISFIIDTIIKEISANYSNRNLSLSAFAINFGISKEYLSKSFTDYIGCGFNEFLTKTRLAASVDLLLSTTFSLAEIAQKCGFKDANYFNAVFKKKLGVTPGNYRLQNISEPNYKYHSDQM